MISSAVLNGGAPPGADRAGIEAHDQPPCVRPKRAGFLHDTLHPGATAVGCSPSHPDSAEVVRHGRNGGIAAGASRGAPPLARPASRAAHPVAAMAAEGQRRIQKSTAVRALRSSPRYRLELSGGARKVAALGRGAAQVDHLDRGGCAADGVPASELSTLVRLSRLEWRRPTAQAAFAQPGAATPPPCRGRARLPPALGRRSSCSSSTTIRPSSGKRAEQSALRC